MPAGGIRSGRPASSIARAASAFACLTASRKACEWRTRFSVFHCFSITAALPRSPPTAAISLVASPPVCSESRSASVRAVVFTQTAA